MTGAPRFPPAKEVTAEFGYYPCNWSVDTGRFLIHTLPDHSQTVADLEGLANISGEWIYPDPARTVDFDNQVHLKPYPSRVFGLPKTHALTLQGSESRHELEFVVWCISFFVGMRLTTADAGFLDAGSIKPGELVDFRVSQKSLAKAVDVSLDYWAAESGEPKTAKRVTAVIHALFLAQRPQSLCFEKFTFLYMALDACNSLLEKKRGSKANGHGDRIAWMCKGFNMPVPVWADQTVSNGPKFSGVRNNTFHEALFFDEPLGFSAYGGNQPGGDSENVILQMQALVCRLLVAILGQSGNAYVITPVHTRQVHGLEL